LQGWKTGTDNADARFHAGPDEYVAHNPGNVERSAEEGHEIDAYDARDANAAIVGVSPYAFIMDRATYNPPNKKIPDTRTFCAVRIWSFQTRGMGTIRIIPSVATLAAALPM
jgi:hypothetical protein